MDKPRRSIILIDGSNFYFKLKDQKLHNLLNLDFSALSKFLASGTNVIHATYYIGKIK